MRWLSVLSENWGKHFNPYSIHSYMTLTKGNLELLSSSLHQKPIHGMIAFAVIQKGPNQWTAGVQPEEEDILYMDGIALIF